MIRISRSGYFVAEKESGFQVEGQINEETLEYLYNLIESSVSADEVASELITANATEEQALSLKEYYPVWRVGMEMEPGKIYRHDTKDGIRLFKAIASQPFTAEAHFPPETTLTLYRDLESHIPPDGQEYPVWKQPTDVIQPITAMAHQTPDLLPAHYTKITLPGENPEWTAGSWDLGAIVTHNGQTWESMVPNNTWEPGAPGVYDNVWRKIEG